MIAEEAILFIDTTLKAKTGKQLTAPEKEILKAAWDSDTYSNVANSLYLSIGHIKDLASLLWQRLSDLLGEKVTKNNFRRLVEHLCAAPSPASSMKIEVSETYQNAEPKGNILIVDDLIENLRFLTEVLNKQGYKVRSVTNGNMALRTVRNNLPDAILLDIKMPDMDGYQVCAALKADENTSDIPVIFLSALDQVIDKVKAFQVGGVDYITKPFQPEEVIARIKTQMTIQQQKHQLRQEIERHQQTVEILYQSRALLASLLNNSLDGIAAMQAVRNAFDGDIEDFHCLVVNPVIAKLFGKKREDMMGKVVKRSQINQLTPDLFDSLVQVVETGEVLEQKFDWESDEDPKSYSLIAVKFGDGVSITVRESGDFKAETRNLVSS